MNCAGLRRKTVLLLILALCGFCFGGDRPYSPPVIDKAWLEVRSPHFRVISDGSERSARRVARDMEQMRQVFLIAFPELQVDSAAEVIALALRDEAGMKTLLPEYWEHSGSKPAGIYQTGMLRDYAIVSLDEVAPWDSYVVSHEYVHGLMHLNFRKMPPWLDEGLAEVYANCQFHESETIVGTESPRMENLRSAPLIPLATLMDITSDSAYFTDPDKARQFYAESWALVHHLIFGAQMQDGKKLAEFLRLLREDVGQKEALVRVFGSLEGIESGFHDELQKVKSSQWTFKASALSDDRAFEVRSLTLGETKAEIGSFLLWRRNYEDGRYLLQQALKEDPNSAAAHEGMGFVLSYDGKDAAAAQEFAKAAGLDGRRHLSLYYSEVKSTDANSIDLAAEQRLERALLKTLEIRPQFAPAYFELARLRVRQANPQAALGLAIRATQLAPNNGEYGELVANIREELGKRALSDAEKNSDKQ